MSAVIEFARGANAVIADTVGALHLCVALSWVSGDAIDRDVDVIALRLSGEGRVGTESDFIFYNAPKCADGSVRMAGRRCVNGRCVDELSVDLAAQPSDVATILIAAVVTSATFQDVTGLELTVRADDLLDPVMRVDLTGARSERAYVAGEFYRRNNEWKFRAIGQGWDTGLAGLAVNYGVDIDTSPPTSAPHTSDAGPESTTRPSTGPIEDLGSISDGSRTPNPTRNPQPNPRPSSPQDRPRPTPSLPYRPPTPKPRSVITQHS